MFFLFLLRTFGETISCTTISDGVYVGVTVEGQVLERRPRAEGFTMLGTVLTFDKRFTTEGESRV